MGGVTKRGTDTRKPLRLSSLLLVEERLLEAEYFLRRLARRRDLETFKYELNAFLAASRSVTFLVQKELSQVPGFREWWRRQQELFARDEAAAFFHKLRNYSQHEGRVSLLGHSSPCGGKARRWIYKFAATAEPVPPALVNRDVVKCCAEYLGKLAIVVLACAEAFPYHSCPRQALTPEGVDALRIELDLVDVTLGYPPGWTSIGGKGNRDDRIACLRKHVDGVDFAAIRRVARIGERFRSETALEDFGANLSASLVNRFERQRDGLDQDDPVLGALVEQLLRPSDEDRKT
jgi:hypothetical protein